MLDRLLHISLSAKIIGLVLALMLIFLAGTFWYFLPLVEEQLLASRREALTHIVHSGHSLLREYALRVRNGELSLEEAQNRAKSRIRNMRFGRNDYLWINDDRLPYPRMLMHPAMPELEGKIMDAPEYASALRMHPVGRKLPVIFADEDKNLFRAVVQTVKQGGAGFVAYEWPRPTEDGATMETFTKESYVILFEPWGWILGTGLYVDDISAKMQELQFTVVSTSFLVLLILLAGALLFSFSITRPVNRLIHFADQVAQGNLDAAPAGRFFGETRQLKQAIAGMVIHLKQSLRQAQKSSDEARLQAESAALATERLAVILRSIGDGVIATNVSGHVLFLNRAAEKLTGWDQAAAQGRFVSEVFQVMDEELGSACDVLQSVLRHGSVIHLGEETQLVARDGTHYHITDSAAPIRDKNSRIIGMVLTFRDQTEARHLRQAALKTEKLESLGVLAGGIAHDFNNSLTAILGNITSAKLSLGDTEKATAKLREAENATHQTRRLTKQLLTFARGGAPIREAVDITELIRETAHFALHGTNLRLETQFPEDIWTVRADPGQISQVVHNLIINAHHAMPEGGLVTLSAVNMSDPQAGKAKRQAGPFVRISVADQGQGIAPELLDKIFEPYFTTSQKGSGLGLTTSHFILKSHGGFIEVDSSPGQGATFHLYLPAAPDQPNPVNHASAPEGNTAATATGRILVMDDEEMIREVSSELLEYLGYSVVTANDGLEAVRLYAQVLEEGKPFDAVIMDLTIPGGMGGKDAVQELLRLDPQARVVVSSGYSTDAVMSDHQRHGFAGVLSKPYSMEQLQQLLQELIPAKESQS